MLEKVFRQHKRHVGTSWRLEETYIKVKGVWKYLYRAIDKEGRTIDFLLTAKRDKSASMRFFDKAIPDNGISEKSHDGQEQFERGSGRSNQWSYGSTDDYSSGKISQQYC